MYICSIVQKLQSNIAQRYNFDHLQKIRIIIYIMIDVIINLQWHT